METLLLLFILLQVTLTLVWVNYRASILDPAILFLLGFLTVSLTLAAGFVEYPETFSVKSFAVASASVVAFHLGALITTHRRLRADETVRARAMRQTHWGVVVAVACAALAYATLTLARGLPLLMSGQLSPANWGDLRAAFWEQAPSTRGSLRALFAVWAQTAAFLAAVSLPFVLKRPALLVVSVLGWSAILLQSLAVAGRFMIVVSGAVAAYGWFLTRGHGPRGPSVRHAIARIRPATRRRLAVGVVLAVYATFVIFPAIRDPGAEGYEELKLQSADGARFGASTRYLVDSLGWEGAPSVVYGLSYLSVPIPKLTFYIERTDVSEWYRIGSYSLPIVPHIQSSVFAETSDWQLTRDRIAEVSAAHGYQTNPWATGVRDFVIDFGLVGAPVTIFFLGWMARSSYVDAVNRPTLFNQLRGSIFGVACFVFAFLSPFLTLPILYSLVALLLIHFFERILITTSVRQAGRSGEAQP